jgi:hypothetical protein
MQGKIENSGWEFSAGYKLNDLSISGSYSITEFNIERAFEWDSSLKILFTRRANAIPSKNAGGLTIGYGFPKLFGHSDRLSTSVNITYTSGAYLIDQERAIMTGL